jgi:transcriptional regulator with GAF, ATPase, and Fis domain
MRRTRYTESTVNILDRVAKAVAPGESAFDAADRLLMNDALAQSAGIQRVAARRLGVSTREMNYRAMRLGIRPKDDHHERSE